MVSNESACVVEVRGVAEPAPLPELSEAELRWRTCWYDLRGQIHTSWLSGLDSSLNGTSLANQSSSKYLWNSLYPAFIKKFDLAEHYCATDIVQSGFWFELIPKIGEKPNAWVEAAGVLGMFKATAGSEEISSSKALSSIEGRTLVVRLAKCLSLYQRCAGTGISNPKTCGLWLLYQALDHDYPEGWRRIRLRYEKSLIEEVEQKKANSPTPADTRAFKRMWVALADKLDTSLYG